MSENNVSIHLGNMRYLHAFVVAYSFSYFMLSPVASFSELSHPSQNLIAFSDILSNRSSEILSELIENALFNSTKKDLQIFPDVDTKCMEDVLLIFQHLNSSWSMQMLDSNGKVPSGTLLGNFLWMGKYQECLDVNIPSNKNGSQLDIHGMYCVATWKMKLPGNLRMPLREIPIKTGVCLPESCRDMDLENYLKYVMNLFYRIPLFEGYGDLLDLNSFHCKDESSHLSKEGSWFLYFLYLYLLLILAGSSVTVFEYILKSFKSSNSCVEIQGPHFVTYGDIENSSELLPMDDNIVLQNGRLQFYSSLEPISDPPRIISSVSFRDGFEKGIKFFRCFCIFSNGAKILDTSSSTKDFPCIHGIRFFSMAWVILGHTYIHNVNIIGNFMDLLHSIDNLPFQVIIQGTFSVDTFFLTSGFLLGYLFLEECDRKNGYINLPLLWLHRLFRILPAYGVLIAFNTLIFKHVSSGPFWGDDSDVSSCRKYWWWNLLYINNFLPMDSMCTTWTWYLANDMQFFVVGILLMYVLYRWRSLGICLIWFFLLSSCILTFYISFRYDVIPLFAGISLAKDYNSYREQILKSWNLIYTKPYCRIGPHLIGLLLAYHMHKTRGCRRNIKVWIKGLSWCIGSFCCLSVIFGMYRIQPNAILYSFYNAFARSSFALGVAWVLHSCISGNGGFINRFLSFKLFVPLSRLTFCAYLFHPLIMSWYFDSLKVPLHFTHANMVMLYFGFLLISYLAAFVISVTFEAPVINLENNLRKKSQRED